MSSLDRIHSAVVDLIVERGYEHTTEALVAERAGVSRVEFDLHFSSLEDCCIQTFDCIAARCEANLYDAYKSQDEWRDRLRAAAYAAVGFMKENPKEARFGLVELSRAADLAQARVEAAIELYADLIDAGRQELEDPDSVSRATAQATVGSILAMVGRESPRVELDEAECLVPELMYIAVRPYLGHEAALEELAGSASAAGQGR